MDDVLHEPVMTGRFIRVNALRIVIGLVLVAAVSVAVFIWMPHQRELRIVREIEALGGQVDFEYCGPPWIPQSIQIRPSFLDRIHVTFPQMIAIQRENAESQTYISIPMSIPMPPDLLSKIGSLNSLSHLYLCDTQVTDAGLEHLKGLKGLYILDLDRTQVTDAGLEHLKGMTNLIILSLDNTQTTAEGRAMLRKALPSCKITPDP